MAIVEKIASKDFVKKKVNWLKSFAVILSVESLIKTETKLNKDNFRGILLQLTTLKEMPMVQHC